MLHNGKEFLKLDYMYKSPKEILVEICAWIGALCLIGAIIWFFVVLVVITAPTDKAQNSNSSKQSKPVAVVEFSAAGETLDIYAVQKL